MASRSWWYDKDDDVSARSSGAAEAEYKRSQEAAKEADEKNREAGQAEHEKHQQAAKDADARFYEDQQRWADEYAKREAERIREAQKEHDRPTEGVDHKSITEEQRGRMDAADDIRRDYVERGEMRDSHALSYNAHGATSWERAANRELSVDRDFAERQQSLATQIRECDPNDKERLETLKTAEFHSHKAASWETIAQQREYCDYDKADIDYARDKQAGHELEAAKALEKLKELDQQRDQEQKLEQGKDAQQQQPGQQAPEAAQDAPKAAEQGKVQEPVQGAAKGAEKDSQEPQQPGSVSKSSFATLDRIGERGEQQQDRNVSAQAQDHVEATTPASEQKERGKDPVMLPPEASQKPSKDAGQQKAPEAGLEPVQARAKAPEQEQDTQGVKKAPETAQEASQPARNVNAQAQDHEDASRPRDADQERGNKLSRDMAAQEPEQGKERNLSADMEAAGNNSRGDRNLSADMEAAEHNPPTPQPAQQRDREEEELRM